MKFISSNKMSFCLCLWLLVTQVHLAHGVEDPWADLQEAFSQPEKSQPQNPEVSHDDPWVTLRTIYLPFSEEEEADALSDQGSAFRVSGHLLRSLQPHAALIRQASDRFKIPQEVIGAVIFMESAGKADAKAKDTSAKGLMQTIDSTFAMARSALAGEGIAIVDDPFDPQASILAGSWYLNHMFHLVAKDRPEEAGGRDNLASWQLPLQYYYAGPGHGRKRSDKIVVYRGGQPRVIDKKAYSDTVLKWARIMRQGAAENRP